MDNKSTAVTASQFRSLPNMRNHGAVDTESVKISQSMSQLKKHIEFSGIHHKPAPFHIRWVYGYNQKAGVINLNDKGSTIAFYAASNCGILYNWTTNQMRILQGHSRMVTCIAADRTGKWLVTADSGVDNILTIWDNNCVPHRTLFSPHGDSRIGRVALSSDAKYLLTLSYGEKEVLNWWIWSYGLDTPHATTQFDIGRDIITSMEFNPDDSEQFALLSRQDLWFGKSQKIIVMERGLLRETDDYELKLRLVEKKIGPECGRPTCFTFVKNTSQILVATSKGCVLIYAYTIDYQGKIVSRNHEDLKFVKAFRIESTRLINVIQSIDGVIVTGNNSGEIHFYDEQMKLLYWIHGFTVDSIKGMSFNISPRSYKIIDPKCGTKCLCWEKVKVAKDPVTGLPYQKLLKRTLPTTATTTSKPIIVRDFIVCTQNQGFGFVDFIEEKIETISDFRRSYILTMTVHPEKPFMCLGYGDGRVELLNFETHKPFSTLNLREYYTIVIPPKNDSLKCVNEIVIPELSVTCLKYSPSGLHLACGMNNGQLIFLDPSTIDIITKVPFKDTSHAIEIINYSQDSLTMAFGDDGKTVGVYKYDCENNQWNFVGKHRAHYKPICAVFFTPNMNENGEFKLLSLGMDRILVEYDIGTSSEEYLEVFSLDRVEQSAVPLDGIIWPNPKGLDLNPDICRTDIPMILMVNDQFKYKIVNYSTTMTLSTVLGPRYHDPVSRVILVNKKDANGNDLQYLLFATKSLIGLQKMPLDGNPWKHVAMLGHPTQITDFNYREDIDTLFTIGAKDSCFCQWAANYESVETMTKCSGKDLDPYYCLIEDGRPGWLFQEIRDLFYYIQILCQGTFSPAMRRVKDYIPIDSLPDLMRALGFFPSEYEVENLLTEARYKVFLRHPTTEIDFEEFVKLYLNHRPAFGDDFFEIRTAFRKFATCRRDVYTITRDAFINMLSRHGECFSRKLSWYLLSILAGHSFEERAVMEEDDFKFLPQRITFSDLANNILGIPDADNIAEDVPDTSGPVINMFLYAGRDED